MENLQERIEPVWEPLLGRLTQETVLMENLQERTEPVLVPLLGRNTIKEGSQAVTMVLGFTCPYTDLLAQESTNEISRWGSFPDTDEL
jgi:hypothetical protein